MPTIESPLNLFVGGSIPVTKTGSIPLFLYGNTAGTTYILGDIDLFISGASDPFNSNLNLYLAGLSETGSSSSPLNISLVGLGTPVSGELDIICYGSTTPHELCLNFLTLEELYSLTLEELHTLPLECTLFHGYPSENYIYLYINGEGENVGFIPDSSYLNLIIWTTPGSESSLPIVTIGQTPTEGELPIIVNGILGYIQNSINISMPVIGISSSQLSIFARGYIN